MCGIAGWFSWSGHSLDRRTMEAMLDRLLHRGPDASGMYFGSGIALGHRRLSIIDIEGGSQPFFSPDRRYGVIFNGQIYNYLELRKSLERKGYAFHTQSDTEVLLNLLIDGNHNALNQTNGMFSFAFWDSHTRTLLLARDRLGVKPLYYYRQKEFVAFSSELKALLALPEFDARLCESSVVDYLSLGYIRAPKTIFSSVSKLEPGHALLITPEGMRDVRWYVRSSTADHNLEPSQLAEQLRSLLEDSVRIRLRSDVPLGSLLSGGIDSSVVTALAAKVKAATTLQTFSVGFGLESDELQFAKLIADKYETRHHEYIVTADSALSELPNLAWHLDEPNGDTAIVPTYLIAKSAAKSVKVVLTGIGGDELFGGYTRYFDGTRLEHWYRKFPLALRERLLTPNLRSLNDVVGWRAEMSDKPDLTRHLWHSGVFVGDALSALFGRMTTPDSFLVPPGLTDPGDLQNSFMAADIEAYLPDDILALTDRLSMAASLEAREPLLDHRIVELCYSVPSNQKLDIYRRNTKLLLKKATRDLLPSQLLNRPKQGFGSPIDVWFKTRMNSVIKNVFSNSSLLAQGILDRNGVSSYLKSGFTYDSIQRPIRLWTLLMLELWVRVYVDGKGERPSFSLSDL